MASRIFRLIDRMAGFEPDDPLLIDSSLKALTFSPAREKLKQLSLVYLYRHPCRQG